MWGGGVGGGCFVIGFKLWVRESERDTERERERVREARREKASKERESEC